MIFRVAMLVCGVGFLAFAALFAAAGEGQRAQQFGLVGAGLILMVAWPSRGVRGYPVYEWVGMALTSAGLWLGGHRVLALVLLPAAFLLLLVAALQSRRRFRLGRALEFEAVGPDEVMPGAEGAVATLEAAGFRRAGGYAAFLPPNGKRVVGTLLLGPVPDREAVVTNGAVEVASRFGGGRWLLTTDSGTATLPPDTLRQLVRKASPQELARAHSAALELLSTTDLHPELLADADEAVQEAVDHERRAIHFAADVGWRHVLSMEPLARRDGVLGGDRRSTRRIAAWQRHSNGQT